MFTLVASQRRYAETSLQNAMMSSRERTSAKAEGYSIERSLMDCVAPLYDAIHQCPRADSWLLRVIFDRPRLRHPLVLRLPLPPHCGGCGNRSRKVCVEIPAKAHHAAASGVGRGSREVKKGVGIGTLSCVYKTRTRSTRSMREGIRIYHLSLSLRGCGFGRTFTQTAPPRVRPA